MPRLPKGLTMSKSFFRVMLEPEAAPPSAMRVKSDFFQLQRR